MSPAKSDNSERTGGMGRMSLAFMELYTASALDRIKLIKAGLPACTIKQLADEMRINHSTLCTALGLVSSTVKKKAAANRPLSLAQSERVAGLAKLIGRLESSLCDANAVENFDAAVWISSWLRESLPAFGGRKPIGFLDTMEGQAMVAGALAQMQGAAFA